VKDADRHAKIVQWSEEDKCFVGRIPDLIYGGCHGLDERVVYDELCQIAEEIIEIHRADGTPLPVPTDFVSSGAAEKAKSRSGSAFKEVSEGFEGLAQRRKRTRTKKTSGKSGSRP
jgi:predicted RNase H-like HicB family nuclease